MEIDDLLSLAEAADALGLAPVTLRAAISRDLLKARKFGNTWVTTRAEVERYRRETLGQVGRSPGYRPTPRGISKWSDVKRKNGVPDEA